MWVKQVVDGSYFSDEGSSSAPREGYEPVRTNCRGRGPTLQPSLSQSLESKVAFSARLMLSKPMPSVNEAIGHVYLSLIPIKSSRGKPSCQVDRIFLARLAGFLCEREEIILDGLYPADGVNCVADRDGVEV